MRAAVLLLALLLTSCGLPPKRPVYDEAFWRSVVDDLPPPEKERAP